MLKVLTNNHYDEILDLFDSSEKSIKIISPFISKSIAEKLCETVQANPEIKCIFITRFYLEDFINKASSIEAIEMMMDAGIEVYALRGLHTKLYLFDSADGVLGSANFTAGGFISNIELSLHIKNETELLNNLQLYYDDMLSKIKQCQESLITKDVLNSAKEKYGHLFSSKKEKGKNFSSYMFGASIDKKSRFDTASDISKEIDLSVNDYDIINDMFKQTEIAEQIFYDHKIWLKFNGEGNNRLVATESFPMTDVMLNGKKVYLSNYPYNVFSIKNNDEIYFAALTTDSKGKNQPVIVGRGHVRGYSKENTVDPSWCLKYNWMENFPYYVIVSECRILDTSVNNGIPMDAVWDELGSDTYVTSFGRNESIEAVARKHYQNAHIILSGNAKQFIDKKLNELEKQFGVLIYTSEV